MSGRDACELASAVRQWRERLAPGDLGLPAGSGRRRTPGLRREEVAQLAGISVDYVVRMEQGRGPRPSASVLSGMAAALRLPQAETDHLFTLAGVAAPGTDGISEVVRPSVLRLMDRMRDLPAMVVNARGDILAWNELLTVVLGDLAVVPAPRRTHLWLHFIADEVFTSRLVVEGDEGARLDRATVAQARAAPATPGTRGCAARSRSCGPGCPAARRCGTNGPCSSATATSRATTSPASGASP